MRDMYILFAISMLAMTSARAQDLAEITKFAESICGSIPEENLTRLEIKGKVKAKANTIAKIITGDANLSADRVSEVYESIPFSNLRLSIPTRAECKSDLSQVIMNEKNKEKKIETEIKCEKPPCDTSPKSKIHTDKVQ